MAPKYELIYFDIRGYVEMMRLLLKDQGIEYIDTTYPVEGERTEWNKVKGEFPFGQVPCLKDGEKKICQTGAIMRHLGRALNLYGNSECDRTFVDMFYEGVRDMRLKYGTYVYNFYDDQEKRKEFLTVTLPTALGQLEKLFKTHANGQHFVLGEKLSFADYALFEELDVVLTLDAHTLDAFPLLKAFHKRMTERPNLKEYVQKRNAAGMWINGNGKQ
ncbi:hypothetical protein L596_020572 [Steinernema carpocapsae]|uniref:Glutathione S-transferase n=1 Tax=Steinernema carpocapsae TaxID=34508 RepID=A0A4U5MTX7_STECR|nr:hypothetical protein L596_020572 [Steinernema carpocapsae]